MGAPRDIPIYEVVCPPNQGGDGQPGRAFGFVVDTGPYRTHTKNNGADPKRGTFMYEGETWCGITCEKVSSASGRYPGRDNNFHSESVSGWAPADGVSPLAEDMYLPGGDDFDSLPDVARAVLVFEYAGSSPGLHGGNTHAPTHFTLPTDVDTYVFTFWEIVWSRTNGSVKAWRQIVGQENLAAGPVINLTNVRTLDPSGVWPGIQLWRGIYSLNFMSGAPIRVQIMLGMWGRSHQQAWDDLPQFVEFQTNSSTGHNATCTLAGSINTSTFPVPNDIAAQLTDPPAGGGGGGGGDPTLPALVDYFGNLHLGSVSGGALTVDAIRGCAFQATEDLTATDIYWVLRGVGINADTALLRAEIYAMSGNPAFGGVPGAKLAESASTALQGDLARQDVRFPLTTNPLLTNGSWYLLALHAGGLPNLTPEWDPTGGFFFFKTPAPYASGAPTPWGSSNSTDFRKFSVVVAGVGVSGGGGTVPLGYSKLRRRGAS